MTGKKKSRNVHCGYRKGRMEKTLGGKNRDGPKDATRTTSGEKGGLKKSNGTWDRVYIREEKEEKRVATGGGSGQPSGSCNRLVSRRDINFCKDAKKNDVGV